MSTLQILAALAALVIVSRAEVALSRMGPHTEFRVRLVFFFLAVGALAVLFQLLAGLVPPVGCVMVLVALAAFLVTDRRLRVRDVRVRSRT